MKFLAQCLLTLSVIVFVGGQDTCELCYDGQEPDLSGGLVLFTQGNLTCPDLISQFEANGMSSMAANTTACGDMQLHAFQIGCCKVPPFQHCDICPDGSKFKGQNVVPFGIADNPTCSVMEYRIGALNAIFTPGTCDDTQLRRSAFYCDCPGVEQECSLCPNKEDGNNLPNRGQKTEKFVTGGSNCAGINYQWSLFTEEECGDATINFGVDLAGYCDCPGTGANGTCSLCEEGYVVTNRNKDFTDPGTGQTYTCQEAEDYAQFVVREDVCDRFFGNARSFCCKSSASTLGVFVAGLIVSVLAVVSLM